MIAFWNYFIYFAVAAVYNPQNEMLRKNETKCLVA